MKPFCEVIVAEVMPVIRAVITKELMDVHGLNQVETARRLGVTQPAISQYRSKLRGKNAKLLLANKKITALVKNLSKNIASGKMNPQKIHEELCRICKSIREEKMICKLHGVQQCYICFGKWTCG